MKQRLILIGLILFSCYASGQDMIRLQYGDSIPSKITEVGRKDVKYLKQHYLDGPVYSIPNRKVIAIEHHNGEVEPLNPDKRTRNFRAGFSLSFAQEVGRITTDEYNSAMLIGIGHEGIIRIRATKRFSVLYHLDMKIGEYTYLGELPGNGYGTRNAYYAIPAAYTGIEFRQPIFKDLGLFANAQIGWMFYLFLDPKTTLFTSPYASYMISLGMYVREFKMGVRYNTGMMAVYNEISKIIPEGDYRLHMLEFVLTWEF